MLSSDGSSDVCSSGLSRELGAFDAQAGDSVSAWLTRFWQKRDALELRSPGDRLEEHLRRWVFVYRDFRLEAPERRSAYLRAWAPPPEIASAECGERVCQNGSILGGTDSFKKKN